MVDMPLQLQSIQIEGNESPVVNWETRCIGNNNYAMTVEPADDSQNLLPNLFARVAALERRESFAWRHRLRNLAAQILLHAAGKQEFRTTKCDYFSRMAAAKDSSLQQVAAGMNKKLEDLGAEADGLMDRRNKDVQPGSLAVLEEKVSDMRECITPALEQACPQEASIVRAYELIKAAFPERFKEAP